jgi:hypothetical protein
MRCGSRQEDWVTTGSPDNLYRHRARSAGSVLIFYAAAHQWLPLLTGPSTLWATGKSGAHRAIRVVALAGGISFLARAFFLQTLSQRTVGMALLCVRLYWR